jgi:superfamily II DNA or RNA helicase
MTPNAATPESPLLAALRRLSTGSLYNLGDRPLVVAALRLFRENAVHSPQWQHQGAELVVGVGNRRSRQVTLRLKDGELAASCECPENGAAGTCRHRLAALFTLKKALTLEGSAGPGGSGEELEAIHRALVAPAAAGGGRKTDRGDTTPRPGDETSWEIELAEYAGALFLAVTRNGRPIAPFDRRLPAPLRPLQPGPYGNGPRLAAALAALLDEGSFRWPVRWREEDRSFPLTVEPPDQRRGRLRLDAGKNGLQLGRVLENGTPLGERLIRIGPWVVDVDRRRLLRLAEPSVWSLWDPIAEDADPGREPGIRNYHGPFGGIEIPEESEAPPALEDFLLCSNGREETPAIERLDDYCLQVKSDTDDGTVTLLGGVRLGERMLLLDPQALALFAEGVFRDLTPPLRAFKRRKALYEAFFAARTAAGRTERSRTLRRHLQGPDFRKRALTREARELLEALLERNRIATWHLTWLEGRWELLGRHRDREADLLAILFRHFGEPAFRNAPAPGELQVPRPLLLANLPALLADLRQAGITLLFDGRPAATTTLDITVEATAREIDWFELHPEIRCEGERLSDGTWRQALAEGMFEANGKLHLLDGPSRRVLEVLAGMGPSGADKKQREIVRLPRLHILDCLTLRRLGARLKLGPEDERILNSLEHFEALPERPEPALDARLRDYQRLGYRWLAFLYEHKFGACLADDMGLGKTIQAISLLAALQQGQVASHAPAPAPHLVVVPPSLLFNWESEIARFAPALRTCLYRGKGRSTDFDGADVVLTSYDLVRRDIAKLAKIPFHVIIFDETQAVKNVRAAVTGAVRRLQGVFKVALTGTPLENHLGEFWSIIDLVLPGLLGDYRPFGKGRAEVAPETMERLIARTRPFLLRRTKEKIAAELPDKVEIDLHLELTDRQKNLYQETVAHIRKEVAAAYRDQSAARARITALAALTRLRRLCLDPRLVADEEGRPAPAPKIAALCDHLAELRDEGHSVLVFSQFTSFLDLVEEALCGQKIPYLRLDGTTPVETRKKLVGQFQASDDPLVFLLSLKAGGRGLNLTRATYVIHLDPWWNPAVENQASDRAHRIGQTRKVTVLRLLMRHTVEEKMMLLKTRKERLFKALLEEGREGGSVPLTREDFEFLVG